jgi:hypothetical protein
MLGCVAAGAQYPGLVTNHFSDLRRCDQPCAAAVFGGSIEADHRLARPVDGSCISCTFISHMRCTRNLVFIAAYLDFGTFGPRPRRDDFTMVHLILTGATGLVGSSVLHQMLVHDGVSRISILSRRPVKMAEGHKDRVKVIIHEDFEQYDAALLEQLKDAHGCVWALGVSQNAVVSNVSVRTACETVLTSYLNL